jgi:organic hydroperoxide reductase OsmC/OhrA
VWSPEDMFVGAVATCYTVTLVSMMRRRNAPLRALEVHSLGDVGQRYDGRYGFVAVDLEVKLETDAGFEIEARGAAVDAEQTCLVAVSLDTPVNLAVQVRTAAAAA